MNIPWRRRSSVVSQLLTVYTLYAGRPAVRGNPSALCAGCATAEYICDVRHPVYKYRTIYVLVSLLPLTTQLIQLRHAAEEQEYATIKNRQRRKLITLSRADASGYWTTRGCHRRLCVLSKQQQQQQDADMTHDSLQLRSSTATVSDMITGYINITPFAKLNTLHTYKQKTVEQYHRVRPRIIIDTESQKR